MKHVYDITGMTCNGCRSHVEKALKEAPGVTNVEVDLEKNEAVIEMNNHIEVSELRNALKAGGGNYNISERHHNRHPVKEGMEHTYYVEGMTCNGCRTHVEKTLNSVEGVENAAVDLQAGTAVINMQKHVQLEKLQQALQADGGSYRISHPERSRDDEGNDVLVQKYNITGMTCNGCRTHVEESLNGVEGVQKAQVDLENKSAQIQMRDHIGIDKFRAALREAGGNYNIFLPGEDQTSHEANSTPPKKEGKGTGTFYCPMHCEGEKTYEQPGNCPVCGMDLVEERKLSFPPTAYTCPMHPEIVRDEPGSCPICGMDLVPIEPKAEEEDAHYKKLLKKFKVAVGFTLSIFVIAMSEMIPRNPLHSWMDPYYWNWVQFALSIPVVFYATWMFFERAYRSIVTGNLNMFTLIGIGAGVAWLFSLAAIVAPDIFPLQFRSPMG